MMSNDRAAALPSATRSNPCYALRYLKALSTAYKVRGVALVLTRGVVQKDLQNLKFAFDEQPLREGDEDGVGGE